MGVPKQRLWCVIWRASTAVNSHNYIYDLIIQKETQNVYFPRVHFSEVMRLRKFLQAVSVPRGVRSFL